MAEWRPGSSSEPQRPGAEIVSRELGDCAVVIDLESNRIFELNESAARVWREIGAGLGLTDIVDRLDAMCPGQRTSIERDTSRLLDDLRQAGLIEPRPEPAAEAAAGRSPSAEPQPPPRFAWSRPQLLQVGTVAQVLRHGGAKLAGRGLDRARED